MRGGNKKLYFIILLISAIIATAWFLFLNKKFNNKYENETKTSTTSDTTNKIMSSDEDKMIIKTDKGDIIINNLYKNPVEKLSLDGVAFKSSSDYYMAYYPQDQGFIITLLNPDLKLAQKRAEEDFIDTLGIGKSQACFLKISVTVPLSVSEKFAGGVYGLSFCPNNNPF